MLRGKGKTTWRGGEQRRTYDIVRGKRQRRTHVTGRRERSKMKKGKEGPLKVAGSGIPQPRSSLGTKKGRFVLVGGGKKNLAEEKKVCGGE